MKKIKNIVIAMALILSTFFVMPLQINAAGLAYFTYGTDVNTKLKQLSFRDLSKTYSNDISNASDGILIRGLEKASVTEFKASACAAYTEDTVDCMKLSADTSPEPIYAWVDWNTEYTDGTLKWYTPSNSEPILNAYSYNVFRGFGAAYDGTYTTEDERIFHCDYKEFDWSKVQYMNDAFVNTKTKVLDLSGEDLSSLVSCSTAFLIYSSSLSPTLNLSGCDISKLTSINQLVAEGNSFTTINLSNADLSGITSLNSVFNNNSMIKSLNLKGTDLSNVTTAKWFLNGASNLETLELTGVKLDSLVYARSMIKGTKVSIIDFSQTPMPNLSSSSGDDDCKGMMRNNTSLKKVLLNSNSFKNEKDFDELFYGDTALEKIAINLVNGDTEFSITSSYTSQGLFTGDTNLVGDNGTVYDSNYVGNTYAHLDGGEGNPGYFSVMTADDMEEYVSENSGWEKIGDNVWKYVFKVFDDTLQYFMSEFNVDDYTSSIDEYTGYEVINSDNSKTGSVTNSKELGAISVSKIVSGIDTDQSFTFTITLTGTDILSGTASYGGIVFKDGVAVISLQDGETTEISGIPIGTEYSVVETENTQYTTEKVYASGTVLTRTDDDGDGTLDVPAGNQAVFTNTYIPQKKTVSTVSFSLEKDVINATDDDADTEFSFYVSLSGLAGNTAYEYEIDDKESGDQVSIVSFTSSSEGSVMVNTLLKAGQIAYFKMLPVNTIYRVSEDAGDWQAKYVISDDSESASIAKETDFNANKNASLSTETETLSEGESNNIVFTNTYDDYVDLTISKVITSDDKTTDRFPITVNFVLPQNYELNSSIGKITADDNGKVSKELLLKDGDSVDFYDIPVGSTYQVIEGAVDRYIASYRIIDANQKGKIIKTYDANTTINTLITTEVETADKGEEITVQFENELATADIEIMKSVTGSMGSRDKEFEFTITITDKDSEPIVGTYSAEGKLESVTFNENGVASFTLSHNDTLKIINVPIGSSFVVSEGDYKAEGYTTTATNNNGTINADSSENEVVFVNTNDPTIPSGVNTSGTGIAIILIVAGVAAAVIIIKKRKEGKENADK